MSLKEVYNKPTYNFNDLMNRKRFNFTEGDITLNIIVIDNAKNNDISSHLLERLLYRLENVESNFTILLTGNNVLAKNDVEKGMYFANDVGKPRSSVLVDKYSDKFSTPLLATSYEFDNLYGFRDLAHSIFKSITINDIINKTIDSDMITVSETFKQQVISYVSTHDEVGDWVKKQSIYKFLVDQNIEFDDILKLNYTFITTNKDNLPVQVTRNRTLEIEDLLETNNEIHYVDNNNNNVTYIPINYQYRYLVLTRERLDSPHGDINDIFVLDTHIFNSDGTFLNFIPDTFNANNIPSYSVSYNYLLNSFASQLIFNELNNMLTGEETDARSLVFNLNGESYKIFEIEIPKVYFDNFEKPFLVTNHDGNITISVEERELITQKLNTLYMENIERVHKNTMTFLTKLLNLDMPIETMPSLARNVLLATDNSTAKPFKMEFYQKQVSDILRGLFTSKNMLIENYIEDRDERIIVSRILSNSLFTYTRLGLDLTQYDYYTDTPYMTALEEFNTNNYDSFKKLTNLVSDLYYTIALTNLIEVWE